MSLLTVSNRVGFTRPPRGPALFFLADMSVRRVDELRSTVTVQSTTAQTTLDTLVVPALSLTGGGAVRLTAAGTLKNATQAAGTVRVRAELVIGGSTVTLAETTAIALSTSAVGRTWQMEVGAIGSTLSTQLRAWSWMAVSAASTQATPASAWTGVGQRTVTVPNSSALADLKVTAQLSHPSTKLKLTAESMTLETLA